MPMRHLSLTQWQTSLHLYNPNSLLNVHHMDFCRQSECSPLFSMFRQGLVTFLRKGTTDAH